MCRAALALLVGAAVVTPAAAQAGSPIKAGGKVEMKGSSSESSSSRKKKKGSFENAKPDKSDKASELMSECASPDKSAVSAVLCCCNTTCVFDKGQVRM